MGRKGERKKKKEKKRPRRAGYKIYLDFLIQFFVGKYFRA